jgi:hypothetical protein
MKLLSLLLALLLATTACRKKDDAPEPCKDTFSISGLGDVCVTKINAIGSSPSQTSISVYGENDRQISGTWNHSGELKAQTYNLQGCTIRSPYGSFTRPIRAFVVITGISGRHYTGTLSVSASNSSGGQGSGSYRFDALHIPRLEDQ